MNLIPNIFGENISEWAFWESSSNLDFLLYKIMNDAYQIGWNKGFIAGIIIGVLSTLLICGLVWEIKRFLNERGTGK
ncbi:hypothetical protein LCGC14_2686280 [marine sediment metagenome]|uniref:Uncharacterized protein n=1 Tax=marine sediment metagenome TaxID=412755 RepID=A0A0F9CBJ2_9ZZZZ